MTATGPDWTEVDAWLDPLAGALPVEHLALVDSYRRPDSTAELPPLWHETETSWQVGAYRYEAG